MTKYPYGYLQMQKTVVKSMNRERSDNKMPLTDAQRRAKSKYKAEKVKKILVEFYASDTGLWEKVQEQENKQGYIKALIKKDIEK